VGSRIRNSSVTSSSFANRRGWRVFILHTWMHICKFRVFPPAFHRLLQSAAEESVLHHCIAEKIACPSVLNYMLLCHTSYTNSVPSEIVANDGLCICEMSAIYVTVICLPYWTTALFNTVRVTWRVRTARTVFIKDTCSTALEISSHWYTLLCVTQLC
jgi:hypothetical protein